jgi:ribosome maturation factor RimP
MELSKQEIERTIAELIESEGFEFVELKLARHRKHHLLRVFADCQGGISLSQCCELSKSIGRKLEEIDPIESAYTLEVSSPGLDRPLLTVADYRRRVGEKVQLEVTDSTGKLQKMEGAIAEVKDDALILESVKGSVEIKVDQIRRGKVVF